MPGFYPIYKLREPSIKKDIPTNNFYDFNVGPLCHLCKILRDGKYKNQSRVVPDLEKAFYGKESDECLKY